MKRRTERASHQRQCRRTVVCVYAQLGDHGIVVHRHYVALVDARLDTH